jgi:nitrogen fixation/metabolism regulation signal transduction histidine kinase
MQVAMKRYLISTLLIVAIMAAFWVYTVIDSLIRQFSQEITYLDLSVIFILGMITVAALGVTLAHKRNRSS